MKKHAFAFAICLAAVTAFAHEHGKSCDMGKGTAISATGTVTCQGDDCTFKTADAKTTYTICEMSKVDLPKLSSEAKTVTAKGKLITCEGKEKFLIDSAE